MKIIDKNKDYYDYLQNVYIDGSLTFDRRGSVNLSKNDILNQFYISIDQYRLCRDNNTNPKCNMLLQICNTFWLFRATITIVDENPVDYKLELVDTWKNYNANRVLMALSYTNPIAYLDDRNIKDKLLHKSDSRLSRGGVDGLFILKDIGIPAVIEPLDIFLAIEEYLSTEKTASERTESIGLTDKDKITNHGFDIKTSFRGKNK